MIEIPDFIEEVIRAGINITISRNNQYGISFDMNLMAKSHMYIVHENGIWYAQMRYNEIHVVENVDDLKRLARHGMHGRDFINADWAEFLMSDKERETLRLKRAALDKLTHEERELLGL